MLEGDLTGKAKRVLDACMPPFRGLADYLHARIGCTLSIHGPQRS